MRGFNIIKKFVGTSFAFVALLVAQSATTSTSFIFYQDEIPEKVRALSSAK